MAKKLDDVIKTIPAARRKRIEQRTQVLSKKYDLFKWIKTLHK